MLDMAHCLTLNERWQLNVTEFLAFIDFHIPHRACVGSFMHFCSNLKMLWNRGRLNDHWRMWEMSKVLVWIACTCSCWLYDRILVFVIFFLSLRHQVSYWKSQRAYFTDIFLASSTSISNLFKSQFPT